MTEEHGAAVDPTGRLGAVVLTAVTRDPDEVVAGVRDRVRKHSPGLDEPAEPIATSEEFAALVRSVWQIVADSLLADEPVDAATCSPATDLAADLVTAGWAPSTVRAAIHHSAQAALSTVLAAWHSRSRRAVDSVLERAVALVAGCEFELLGAFERDTARFRDTAAEVSQRRRDAFLRRVLEEPVSDPEATLSRAKALNLDLSAPIGLVLLVEPPPGIDEIDLTAPDFEDRVVECRGRLPVHMPPPVFSDPSPASPWEAVLLVPSLREPAGTEFHRAMEAASADLNLIGIRAIAADMTAVPVLCARMRQCAPILERCVDHVGPVPDLDELLPYRVMAELPEREALDLLLTELGPLQENARYAEQRVATWRLLVRENPSDADAARRLGITASALTKRKRMIESLLGRDLSGNVFPAAMASYLLDLWGTHLPPSGDPWWRSPPAGAVSTSGMDRLSVPVPRSGEQGRTPAPPPTRQA